MQSTSSHYACSVVSMDSLAWLAGIIDADGYIGLQKVGEHYYVRVEIYNRNWELIERVANALRRLGVSFSIFYSHGDFTVRVGRMRDVYNFLRMLRPYLIAKLPRADICLRYLNHRLKNYGKPYGDVERDLIRQFHSLEQS